MDQNILKQYHKKDDIEVGLDEAGRGCLFGPVCVAGVIWLNEDPENSFYCFLYHLYLLCLQKV